MQILSSVKVFFLAAMFSTAGQVAYAQADPLEGNWLSEDKTAKVQIYKSNNKFYGKLAWLKEPNRDGKPKLDHKNPDVKKRTQPLMGLVLLRDFIKEGKNEYEDGTIYDPKSGKTYSCKMTLEGNKLNVRGYVGVSMLGRTSVFTKSD